MEQISRLDERLRMFWDTRVSAKPRRSVGELKGALRAACKELTYHRGDGPSWFSLPTMQTMKRFVDEVRALAGLSGITKTEHVYLWSVIRRLDKTHRLHLVDAIEVVVQRVGETVEHCRLVELLGLDYFRTQRLVLGEETNRLKLLSLLSDFPYNHHEIEKFIGSQHALDYLLRYASKNFSKIYAESSIRGVVDPGFRLKRFASWAAFLDIAARFWKDRRDRTYSGFELSATSVTLELYPSWLQYLHHPDRAKVMPQFDPQYDVTDEEWRHWNSIQLARERKRNFRKKSSRRLS